MKVDPNQSNKKQRKEKRTLRRKAHRHDVVGFRLAANGKLVPVTTEQR